MYLQQYYSCPFYVGFSTTEGPEWTEILSEPTTEAYNDLHMDFVSYITEGSFPKGQIETIIQQYEAMRSRNASRQRIRDYIQSVYEGQMPRLKDTLQCIRKVKRFRQKLQHFPSISGFVGDMHSHCRK